jgi:hypothetical protein
MRWRNRFVVVRGEFMGRAQPVAGPLFILKHCRSMGFAGRNRFIHGKNYPGNTLTTRLRFL